MLAQNVLWGKYIFCDQCKKEKPGRSKMTLYETFSFAFFAQVKKITAKLFELTHNVLKYIRIFLSIFDILKSFKKYFTQQVHLHPWTETLSDCKHRVPAILATGQLTAKQRGIDDHDVRSGRTPGSRPVLVAGHPDASPLVLTACDIRRKLQRPSATHKKKSGVLKLML